MPSKRLLESVVDSAMWLVGGGLLVVLALATVALGPTAIGWWF